MVAAAIAGWIVAAAVMAALWLWQRHSRNATVVDAGSTLLIGGLAVLYAATGSGAWTRRSAIAWMMGSWAARLGVYLLWDRVFERSEAARYLAMRTSWGQRADVEFFWLFQKRALAAVFFAIPALIAAQNAEPALAPIELAAAALWIVGFAGESTADRQLLRFRRNPENCGQTCASGLWRYSRHPNYFFESVMWFAYALFAAASPHGWIAMACPATMLYLLCKVTGIPPGEAQAVQSRGAAYREYQRTTSALVPWFPRS